MDSAALEFRVRKIAKLVDVGQQVEDDRVEVKRSWIDHWGAAWRMAGHANVAGGERIIWIFGLDENGSEGKRAVGVETEDQAKWIGQVESNYEGLPPRRVREMGVPFAGRMLFVYLLETNRAPYVVKNPKGGPIQFGIPWRDGTRVRSAKHEDLVEILVPHVSMPSVEILEGFVRASQDSRDDFVRVEARLGAYLEPRDYGPLAIPFHRCGGGFSVANGNWRLDFDSVRIAPPDRSITASGDGSQCILQGPSKVSILAYSRHSIPDFELSGEAEISIHLGFQNTVRTRHFVTRLEDKTDEDHEDRFFRYWEVSAK